MRKKRLLKVHTHEIFQNLFFLYAGLFTSVMMKGLYYCIKCVYGRSQAGPSISPAFYRKITVAEEETILTNEVFHISVIPLKEGIKTVK